MSAKCNTITVERLQTQHFLRKNNDTANDTIVSLAVSDLMQLAGLEPAPTYMDMNLNHARMPIPPQLLNTVTIHDTV